MYFFSFQVQKVIIFYLIIGSGKWHYTQISFKGYKMHRPHYLHTFYRLGGLKATLQSINEIYVLRRPNFMAKIDLCKPFLLNSTLRCDHDLTRQKMITATFSFDLSGKSNHLSGSGHFPALVNVAGN